MTPINLLIVLIYSFCCVSFGTGILFLVRQRGSWHDKHSSFFSWVITGFLLGLGGLSVIWMALALAGLLVSASVWLVVICCLAMGILGGRRVFVEQAPGEIREVVSAIWRLSIFWKIIFLSVIAATFLLGTGAALSPPSGDAEAFYMVLPKIVAETGHLVPQRNYYAFSQIGLVAEMHYAAIMIIADPHSAMFFTWVTSLAAGGAMLLICSQMGIGSRGLIFSALALLTSTAFTSTITDGKVDNYGAALGLGAIYWAMREGIKGRNNTVALALTGIFAGFAAVAKFPYILGVLPTVYLLVVFNNVAKASGAGVRAFIMGSFRPVLLLSAFAAVSVLPHLIKNAILFAEPFAPFYYFDSTVISWADQVWYDAEATRFILLTYPVALTLGKYPMQGGNISPLVLAILPLALLMKKPESVLKSRPLQIAFALAVSLILWMIARPSVLAPRYILASLIMFIPLTAYVLQYVLEKKEDFKFVRVVILFVVGFSVIFFGIFIHHAQTLTKKLGGTLGACENASKNCTQLTLVGDIVPPGQRVFFQDYYSYFLRTDLLQTINDSNENAGLSKIKDPDEALEFLYDRGFNYAYINKSTHAESLKRINNASTGKKIEAVLLFDTSDVVLYRIKSMDSSLIPSVRTMKNGSIWEVVEEDVGTRSQNRDN